MIDYINRTFTLDDLDQIFYEKVIYIEWVHTSGFGEGWIMFLTEDREEYFISFSNFPELEYKIYKEIPLLKIDEDGFKIVKKNWTYLKNQSISAVLIRNDIAGLFIFICDKLREENLILIKSNVVKRILETDGKMFKERINCIGNEILYSE